MRTVNALGFIGLGVMGGRMCRNLIRKSQQPVNYFDLSPERRAYVAEVGGVEASSAADVVAKSDMVFFCLPGEPQVRALWFGDEPLIDSVETGQVIVDTSDQSIPFFFVARVFPKSAPPVMHLKQSACCRA